MFDELGVPIKPRNPPVLLKMSLLENPLVTDGFLSELNLYEEFMDFPNSHV